MPERLRRSMETPIREGLIWEEIWLGPDRGLYRCWERGRQKRIEDPELADRAIEGELPVLVWKGGVEKKLEVEQKSGTLKYLAMWQGLRGEDLDIALEKERIIICARTGQAVKFSAGVLAEEE